LLEDLQVLEELPGCATGRVHWLEDSVTSICDRLPIFCADSPGPHVLPTKLLATLWRAANDEDNVQLLDTDVEVPASLAVLEDVTPDPSEVALAAAIIAGDKNVYSARTEVPAAIIAGDKNVYSARTEVPVDTGVYVATDPVLLDNANASTLALTAIANEEVLPLNTWTVSQVTYRGQGDTGHNQRQVIKVRTRTSEKAEIDIQRTLKSRQ